MSFSLSIVTINYNNKFGLIKTLDSVNNQTNKNFEYVVIDGNSTDGSIEIIKKNATSNYKYLIEDDNGVYDAFNKGINNSSSNFILFLNSGDTFIDSESVNFILSSLSPDFLLNIYGINLIKSSSEISILNLPCKIDLVYVLKNFIPHPSTVISKELFFKIGLFNTSFKFAGDHEFFVRFFLSTFSLQYKVHDRILANHYLDGISNEKLNVKRILNERKRALNENLNNEILRDVIDFYLEFHKLNFLLKGIKKAIKCFILTK
jgi:glycosyltransferase involved in cell wall biosynthesis